MSTTNANTCPHGNALLVVEFDGWKRKVPQDCVLCRESGWTSAGYKDGPPQGTEETT